MRVLLTADGTQDRPALKTLLEQEPDLRVVATAHGARDLQHQVQAIEPDLVLLDWDLPDLRVSHLLATLRSLHPNLKIVAFSQDRDARQAALEAGADAFVSRDSPFEWLLMTMCTVGQLSPHLVV
jgi:DNA-binding NarL/FixJ family response regulator